VSEARFDPGTLIDRFEIVRLLGRGGFGAVYQARDTDLGRHVALKILRLDGPGDRSSLLAMFHAEAEAAARLNHPNVVTLHDHGVHDGTPYLVLELLAGETLAQRLARGPLPAADAIAILAQVCRGLVHAHAAGVVHRDLKPSNVFLRDDGVVKILDFGLARVGRALARPGGTPAYAAPEQWRGDPEDERADVFACGVMLFELLAGRLPPAEIDPEMELAGVAPRLAALCGRALAPDPRERAPSAQAFLEVLQSLGDNGGEEAASPYRFLEQFTEADAGWFFGRDAEILRLEQMLATRPLVAVVGHPGAGKSSLIHAGLVPRLRRSGRWRIVTMRPGADPAARLHERLVDACGEAWVTASLPDAAALVAAPGRAGLLLRTRAAAEGTSVLLVVDQLEELVTHGAPAAVRRAFARALLSIGDDAQGPLRVVVALRDDFLVRLTRSAELGEALLPGVVLLGPPGPEGLADALRAPATRAGFGFEPGLVEAMVAAVAGEAAPLPLLQLAASRVWARRDAKARLLTRAGLDAVGGVAGILAAHAGEVLARAPDLALSRRLLCALVTPEGTRRRVRRDELCAAFPDAAAAREALETLVAGRLVSAVRSEGGEWVELAHESLIAGWDQLRAWLDEERADLRFHERLVAAATLWRERRRPAELLWRGDTLDEALRWRRRFAGSLGETEVLFLGRCEAGLRRRRRLHRGVFVAAAAAAVLGAVASSIAVPSYRAAAREARLRAVVERAAAAVDPLVGALVLAELADSTEPPGGLAAAVRVAARPVPLVEYRGHRGTVLWCEWSPDERHVALATFTRPTDPTKDWDDRALILRSDGSGAPVVLESHGLGAMWGRFSPDGRHYVTVGEQPRIWRVDGAGAPLVLPAPRPAGLYGWSPSFTPDGQKVLLSSWESWSAWLWRTDGRGEPLVFPLYLTVYQFANLRRPQGSAVLSPDGRKILVAGEGLGLWRADGIPLGFFMGNTWDYAFFSPDGSRIWARRTNNEIWTFRSDLTTPAHIPGVYGGAAFSADGRRLVYGSDYSGVHVTASDGTGPVVTLRLRPSITYPMWESGLGLSPDGARVLVTGTDRAQLFWADGLGEPILYPQPGDLLPSPSGTRFLACDPVLSRKARIWSAGDPPGTRSFHGHRATVVSAVASSDGRTLLTGSVDGTVRLWPLGGGAAAVLGAEGGRPIADAVFSSDGQRVLTARGDRRLEVWPIAGGAPATIELPSPATRIAFSPDGALLAAGGEDRVLLLRPDGAGPVASLVATSLDGLAFTPDGARLVAAADPGPGLAWRTDDWAAPPTPFAAASGRAVAISPDGARIAVGLADGTARIARLDSKGELVAVGSHPGAVHSVAFTPDGKWLATTAEDDPEAHLWLVDWAALTHALRDATTACLTPEERAAYLDEDAGDARAAWAACERRHGRVPQTASDGT
jgi:WD40 repeat protein